MSSAPRATPMSHTSRVRRLLRLPDRRQPPRVARAEQGPDNKPSSSDSPSSSGNIPHPEGNVASTTLLLSDQSNPTTPSGSSSSPTPASVSTSVESLSIDSEEEMPLRLPKLRRLRKSKESLNEKATDATSQVSVTSIDSWTQQAAAEVNGGYTVGKLKELSKLHKAVWKDDLTKVKAAIVGLKKAMYVNYFDKEGRTALHFACARGHVDIVKAVCDGGANPNMADNQGATPLHKLLESGCNGGVIHLLGNGADPNTADNLGRTPLHLAAKYGDVSTVAILLAKGARIEAIEKCGLTPLHIATLNGHRDVASVLSQEGANLDYLDSSGRTALMLACVEGRSAMVQLFVESGAKTELKDNEGLTALDLALAGNHQSCAVLLTSQGSQKVASSSSFVREPSISSLYTSGATNEIGGPATNQIVDESVSEEVSYGGDDSWGASDTEDDLLSPRRSGTVNLKGALGHKPAERSPESEKTIIAPSFAVSKPLDLVIEASKGQTTPTARSDPTHYHLKTTPLVNEGAEPELTESSQWDSEDDDVVSPFELPDDSPRKLPSIMTMPRPPLSQTTTLKEATPPAAEPVGRVSRDTSLEGMLTLDEEVSDSECSDLDYVEDVMTYVPSTGGPLKHSTASLQSSPDKTDTFAVTPLSSGHFTSEFLSPDSSGPSRPTTGRPRQPRGVVSDEELSDILESDNESVERLLKEAGQLAAKASPVKMEYEEESDWDDGEEVSEDESEDEELQVSALMTMSGASLHEPVLSPPRSPCKEEKLEEPKVTPPTETTPPSDSEESELNFDSDDNGLDDLLPSEPAAKPHPPLTASLSALESPVHTSSSPTLSPLHGNSSLRNLPPLTISSRLSPPRLRPLSPLKSPPSPAKLGPIANEQRPLLKPANEQGPPLKPANEQGHSLDSSFDSETESEWEREKKEKKCLSSSQQFDSGLDTMSTVRSEGLKIETSSKALDKLQEGKLNSRSTCVDPPLDKTTSTCVDPQLSSSTDKSTVTSHSKESMTDSSLSSRPSRPLNSPSLSPARLAPLRLPGSISNDALEAYKNLPGGQSSTSSPDLSQEDAPPIKPSNEQTSTVKEETPVIPSTNEVPAQPIIESIPVQASRESISTQPSKDSISIQPSKESISFQLNSESIQVQPSKESIPVQPSSESIPVQTSNESILEMLSEMTEDLSETEDEADFGADFSGSNLDTISPPPVTFEQLPVTREEPHLQANEVSGSLKEAQVKVQPIENAANLQTTELTEAVEPQALTKQPVAEAVSSEKTLTVTKEPVQLHIAKDASLLTREQSQSAHPVTKLSIKQESTAGIDAPDGVVAQPPGLSPEASGQSLTSEWSPALSKESSHQSTLSESEPGSTRLALNTDKSGLLAPLPDHKATEPLKKPVSRHNTLEPLSELRPKPLTELVSAKPQVLATYSSSPGLSSSTPSDVLKAPSKQEVKLKPHTVAALAETSSGDLKQETEPSKTNPGPKTETKKVTPSKPEIASASDSRLELRRGPLYERTGPLDEVILSEESDLSMSTSLSCHDFPRNTTLTASQLHPSALSRPHAHTLPPVESGEDLPPDLSLSELSGPLDNQLSQDILSQSSKMSDDLPLSHLMRLNQSLRSSQLGGAPLLGSAHTAQLQESLRGVSHDLERSQNEAAASERVRRQLESQLDDAHKKYNTAITSKMSLENVKLDLELQVRELKYQLDQSREGLKSHEGINSQLKEQLDRMELKLSREIESRQAAELKCREAELGHRTLSISHQTLQEELAQVNSRLQGEREAKMLQEGLFKEQGRVYDTLKEESVRAQEVKSELVTKLEHADKARQGLHTQVSELTKSNSTLHTQLASERTKSSELEGQLELVRGELRTVTHGQSCAEDSLVETRAQFEGYLQELKEKAEYLSAALDKETELRGQAQEETASLQTKLSSLTGQLEGTQTQGREREGMLTQQIEHLKQEQALREKDLEIARNLHSQQSVKTEALESKLVDTEKELKATNTLLFERANQIAALQRDVDHKSSRVSSLEETLQVEHVRQSKLETQLGVANEKIVSLQSEGVALQQRVEFAQRRVEEKEQSGLLTQQRFDDLLSTLRTEYDKSKSTLEARCQSLLETQASLREDLVRREEKMAALQRDKEELSQKVSQLQSSLAELQERLKGTEEAYSDLEAEKNDLMKAADQLEAKIGELVSDLTAKVHQTSLLEEKLVGLQTSLEEAHQTTRVALDDKQSVLEQKAKVENQLQEAFRKISSLEAELETSANREQSLESKLTHLGEIRSTLETHLSEAQGELVQTRTELEVATSTRDKAVNEAEEARGLWESEVRSKSKLGVRLMELEKSRGDANGLVDAERRHTKKALELKKGAEWKLEALQREHTQLSSEVASTRAHLKQSKRRVQELELRQSQVPSLEAEYDKEVSAMQREMDGLKQLVSSAEGHYKRESERRRRAEQNTSKVRQELEELRTELSLGKSDSQSKRKEVTKLERANRKLRDELVSLQDHVANHMVSRAELESHKKAIEEKAHRELTRKLEEVNLHLEQQSAAQEAMARLRSDAEAEQREQFDRSTTEMRLQLGQCESDMHTVLSEAKRYKELFEAEALKTSNLSSQLQRAREDSEDYQSKLSLERNRTHQLMNVTQTNALGSLTPPRHTRYTESHPHTSTPHSLTPPQGNDLLSPTDSLLNTVRSKLDQSIARHKDRVPGKRDHIGTATRSTYSPHKTSLDNLPSKQSHLDAIRRTYRI